MLRIVTPHCGEVKQKIQFFCKGTFARLLRFDVTIAKGSGDIGYA